MCLSDRNEAQFRPSAHCCTDVRRLFKGTDSRRIGRSGSQDLLRPLADDYEGFLRGKVTSDSLPDDYRAQLLTSYKQYKQTLDEMHGGVASVTISNTRNDSLMQMMQAFLLLHFKDSTKEEIIVPMVLEGAEWKMR